MRRLIFLALLACSPLLALDLCNRCWEVGGAALYWKPCTTPYSYAAQVKGNDGDLRKFVLRPDYDWGFKIYGNTYTHDSCHIFLVDWTHLRTCDSISQGLTNLYIYPTNDELTSVDVSARVKTRYDRVSIRAGRYISCHCESTTYVFGGLRYIDIEENREVLGLSQDERGGNVEKSSFEGAAVEVGLGVTVQEPCGFSLVGRFSGVMAFGERKHQQRIPIGSADRIYEEPTESACLPGVEFSVAGQWRYGCGCYWFDIELGYELHHYFDALRFMTPGIGNPFIPATSLAGIGFAGPYLAASVRF